MSQRGYRTKPPARVVAIKEAETETQGTLQGVVDAALRIAEARAQRHRRMREAILANDTAGALALACELTGFSQREIAKRVEGLLATVTRSTP
jgi:hypothetical protein